MNRYFVCGDIGGTKILLWLGQSIDDTTKVHLEHQYHSSNFTSFSEVLKDFLSKAKGCAPATACFAVAGPIAAQCSNLTNLPWQIDAVKITEEFSIPNVKLINDFEAAALSIENLPEKDLEILQAGNLQAQSMKVVLGAGTGMGVAWLIWQDNCYTPLSTEAGHVDFAPSNSLQDNFLEFQRKKYGHVSIERILSGSGLADTFNFLQTALNKNNQLIQTSISTNNAQMVTDLALNRKHPIAMKALNLFIEIYGAYAGNLALTGLCHGGVYLTGGIAPKIIDKLKEGNFVKSFCSKGRYSKMMKSFPIHVVMNPKIGVMGAMREIQRIESFRS